MANKNTDYRALAKEILANVGGKENVTNCFHCNKIITNCICFILMLIIFETDKCEAVIRCKAA